MNALKNLTNLRDRSTRGETITEVLVSVLIAGLALLMLATVIASVSNIVNSSGNALDGYYVANNNLATMDESSTGGTAVIKKGTDSAYWLMSRPTVSGGSYASVAAEIDKIEYKTQSVGDTTIITYERAAS